MNKNHFIIALLMLCLGCTSEESSVNQEINASPQLKSIYFDRTHNEALPVNVNFQQQGDKFLAKVNRNVSRKVLIPTFEVEGEKVLLGGSEIQSGVSPANFTTTQTLEVTSEGFESKSYDIEVVRFTNLPIVDIRTQNSQPIDQKEDYVKATISMFSDVHEEYNFTDLTGGIRGRGNSTWYFHEKKPYQLKFDEKQSMFGLPKDKKWIFLAEQSDKTLLRNRLAFEMGRISTLPYTPKGEMAEVFLNDQYIGTYHICQKVEESSNRVDLKDDGWLMEIDQLDRIDEGDTYFSTNTFYINIKDPDTDFNSESYTHVRDHINDFENALMGEDFRDTEKGYRKYVDMTTFADWFLINEILRNPDARNWSSIYLTYIRGEKITMGPLWDFDLALGNSTYDDYVHGNTSGFWVRDNPWIDRMLDDPEFAKVVRERLNYYKSELPNLLQFIDDNASYLQYAQVENDKKWDVIGVYHWPNLFVYDTYEEEVNHIKRFMSERLEWLDENL
ncbi:CotH kinase family protein [Flammeovirga aprica]|uniref:Spore coat protein CotH n=1 Tax=Flammeovirga aprica JL-4 TaxID=694437 RepID=A0A7X9XCE6_9BACT|nr:CotH kinase family protein [Flammeovirga aprica]NME71668.1 hypothetical protein [Flammeovirga aprica JL-4]